MNICVYKWETHVPARWALINSTCKQLTKSELCTSLWVNYERMVPLQKCFNRGQVALWRHFNKWSSHTVLIKGLLKTFKRWPLVSEVSEFTARIPLVQQVNVFQEIILCWLFFWMQHVALKLWQGFLIPCCGRGAYWWWLCFLIKPSIYAFIDTLK